MLSKVISASVTGIDANIVQVETDVSNGIPSFIMTGYVGARVREAGDRVRTAIKNVGYKLPCARIVVNVSPASIRKSGTMLDLPIAVGILCDMGIIDETALRQTLIVGEMSLDGTINPIRGVLPMVDEAKKCGLKCCIIPRKNLKEAAMIDGIRIYGAENLQDVISIFARNEETEKNVDFVYYNHNVSQGLDLKPTIRNLTESSLDFADVKGQHAAKRAILIASAGRHNILMSGPPGSGKTLLASRIPSILPELNEQELIDVYKIYSVVGKLQDVECHMSQRPFRSPHHTITQAALLGGGAVPVPGEITLAHNGVLFLDELTKFKSSIIECLRQPLEEQNITIIRNGEVCHFPADFMLVAAMNPCKCGFYPDRNICRCTEIDILQHMGRLSRPFLDRFDMAVHIDRPQYDELAGTSCYEISQMIKKVCENNTYSPVLTSFEMKKSVLRVLEIQKIRYEGTDIRYNSRLSAGQIKKFCRLEPEADDLMRAAYEKYNLSARGYGKILKVARTIADLENSEIIRINHLSEAICFRNLDMEE